MKRERTRLLILPANGRSLVATEADEAYARAEARYNSIGANREWLERAPRLEQALREARMNMRFDSN